MKKKLVIVGTGLFADLALVYFRREAAYEVVAFSADAAHAARSPRFHDLEVVAFDDIEARFPPAGHEVFVAIGYSGLNTVRARFFAAAKAKGYRMASYVHPSVERWEETKIGENVFVFEDNTLQPFVGIGDDTILWSGNHIGHHTQVGAHCFIASHVVVSGNCRIGDYSFLGVNATLRDDTVIGQRNIIGPNALIMGNTTDGQVFMPRGTEARSVTSDRVRI